MNGNTVSDFFNRDWFRFSSRQLRRGFQRRVAAACKKTGLCLSSEALEPRLMMAITPPSISIDDVTITEGDAGTQNAAITLRLSQPASNTVSVRFATAGGTATAGSDFVAKAGSVSFAAGTTTRQVLIAIKGDRAYEPNETFSINLSSPTRATIADQSGIVTILNNDPAPAPPPVPVSTPTPSTAVQFAVTSNWGSGFNGDVTIRNTTGLAYGSWTVEFDFDGQITTLWNGVIASQSGSRYTVRNESWNGSLAAGGSTTFGFTATPGGSAAVLRNITLIGSAAATPTPTPIPTPTPTPSPTPTPIDGTTGRVFLVNPAAADIVGFDPSRDRLDFADVSVHNLIIAKTESGEVAIVNPWASTPEFQVLRGIGYRDLTMANFGVVQNEHLRQDIGGVVAWEQGIGPRDSSTVYVRSHEYGVRQRIEGFNPAAMKLSFLYFGTRERLSVTDTAEGLSISVLPTNQSILLVGVTKAQLVPENVEFHHDQIVEDQLEVPFNHPAEHFTLVSRASLLTPTAPAGQATDGSQTSIGQTQPGGHNHGTMPMPMPMPTPTPGITVGDLSITEGNPQAASGTGSAVTTTPLTFTVSLSVASAQPVTVQYATANGTAVVGSDYAAASGTLTFAPGETQKPVTVLVSRDSTAESSETLSLILFSATNATLTKAAATGTIVDDDTLAANPNPTPNPTLTSGIAVTYSQTSDWGTGFNGDLKITNGGTTPISGWTMEFDMAANIVAIWNAEIVSHVGTRYVIRNAAWNGTLAAGAEISFGFQADGIAGELPTRKKVNGQLVA